MLKSLVFMKGSIFNLYSNLCATIYKEPRLLETVTTVTTGTVTGRILTVMTTTGTLGNTGSDITGQSLSYHY